ncbi:hypothetical protein G9A89_024000 [Geosiphon pyriformis]|nr:hypothetical protein G9A89_024000 [Geosiphon pyriformis]
MVVHQLIFNSLNQLLGLCQQNSKTDKTEPNQNKPLTSNISPAIIMENKLLAAIFSFEMEELSEISLFSEAIFEEKPIIAIYINAKIDGHSIKLILDSGSASSIITKQLMDQLSYQVNWAANARIIMADGMTKISIGKIDDFPIKVNGIIVPIKILVMEATQYQALIGNDWLSKTNVNGQHTRVPAFCGHFKPTTIQPLIKLKEEETKSTWKAYQVSWADKNHNELLPVLLWDDQKKRKRREELTWDTDQLS